LRLKNATMNGINSYKVLVNIYTKKQYYSEILMYYKDLDKMPNTISILTIISIIYNDPGWSKSKQK